MKTFLLTFLGGLAALVVFFVLFPLVLIMSFVPSGEPPRVSNAVLELDLRKGFPDQPAADPVNAVFTDTSFVEVLLRLNAAATDPNVKGVFVRAAEMDMGSSRAEELRSAFLRLKQNGKFIVAHSQGFLASGPAAYRAISAADEIWMQPGTMFEAPGIAFETLFLGPAFDKFKVEAEIEQFYEFKNAADVYKRGSYSTAHATAMTELATSVWNHSIADIAADRKSTPEAVKGILEASPYPAQRAADLKLVDRLGWPEEAAEAAAKRADGKLVDIANYQPLRRGGRARIAIVGGEGDIVTGSGGPIDVFSLGVPMFASDRIAATLLKIAEDESIHAVVFRVDSGGGSATASDQIWNAVERLKKAGKKVVVSMGSVAASGGYYVAAGADAILASRSTITGSIGVFGGKFAIADALREFGISPDEVHVGGEFSTAYSSEKFTPNQRAKLLEGLQDVYDRFTNLVATGRKIPLQKVQEVARGRVWSGEDALKNGLIDQTGDLIDAIEKAKQLAGFKPEDGVELRMPVVRSSPLDLIASTLISVETKGAGQQGQVIDALAAIVGRNRAEALIAQLRQLGQQGGAQVRSPPIVER